MIKPFNDFSDIATVINHDLVKLKWKTAHFSEKIPCSLHQYVATMKISSIGLILHVTHETSINSERLQKQSIFSFFSLTPGDDC